MKLIYTTAYQWSIFKIGSNSFTVIFWIIRPFGADGYFKYQMANGTQQSCLWMVRSYFSAATTKGNASFRKSIKNCESSRLHVAGTTLQSCTRTGRSYSSARMTRASVHCQTAWTETLPKCHAARIIQQSYRRMVQCISLGAMNTANVRN